ncbi:MAG TPA: TAT-variant-translocated molybdopterin oxidoreductase [Hyphomicrobiaceae bacterium]|nr:TAT-variant-translocated molybdopterin oxidoreductase [Hyphomicrobiaceae bacterium]
MSATDSLRDQLKDEPLARFWRSLDELSRTPSFRVQLSREFPEIASRFGDGVRTNRRTALRLLGASLLMAGVAACKAPEGIAPYVTQPEQLIPGRPKFYATSIPIDGYAMGVLAESHDGRPTKVEGNPLHPASLGGTDSIMQASVWSLYDPGRSRVVRQGTEVSTWTSFQAELANLRAARPDGAGIGIAIGAETSPTLRRQLQALKAQMPALRVYRHAPLSPIDDAVPIHDLSKARTIVSLGGDFLGEGPEKLAYARAFADGRRVRRNTRTMSRLYVIESAPTLTGANADWVRRVKPSQMDGIVAAILAGLDGTVPDDEALRPLIVDLKASSAALLTGSQSSPYVRAAVRLMNDRVGAAVRYVAPLQIEGDGTLRDLVADIDNGHVEHLLVLDVDLVHSAPADISVAPALAKLQRLYHHGLHLDATARLAHWHVPATHALESWSDALAYEGTASLMQPLIAPLYQGRTAHEVIASLSGDFTTSARDLVRATWSNLDDGSWAAALKTGRVDNSAAASITLSPVALGAPSAASAGPELVLTADPYFRDGAWAANLPLTELPRPLSKIVWGNAAEMSAATAKALGVVDGDEVDITRGGARVALPAFVLPGMPDEVIAVSVGWGRDLGETEPVGVNAFGLLDDAGPVAVTRTGRAVRVITTQEFHSMEGRDLVREVALDEWPGPAGIPSEQPTLLPKWEEPEEAWGMSIDLTSCIGCMACVSACQAENNSPVVGPDEMARGHDMHWLRVDRYFSGDAVAPETSFQPVPCMQCEDAPCEVVCPVNATVHTHDGLNAQVYNRCVGTRYCSQNCPYKVRRFNWFDYNADVSETSPLSLLMNPDVSVRERGVMEKCTYCVQRIAEARINGDITDSPIADGTVMTACQQACPTRAITFGNIKDRAAKVVAEKAEPTNYAMLAELGTRPRTTYLSKVRNRV